MMEVPITKENPKLPSPLEIIYEDEELIAINKPHDLLVHRTKLAKDVNIFALQLLRDQIGMKVYPGHRLDRKTSGVLLFAKSEKSNKEIQEVFRSRKISKTYEAIVRGFAPENGIIDYPIGEKTKKMDATTHYSLLQKYEIELPFYKFPTSRYSHIELKPETGRFHQLRKHMAHIFHPIIGDRPHGCNKQNKLWKEKFNMTSMLLHAKELSFKLENGKNITIKASLSPTFTYVLGMLNEKNIKD